jgi:hypothetical protein
MRAPFRLLVFAAVPLAVFCICVVLSADGRGVSRTALGAWLREVQRGEKLKASESNLLRSIERVRALVVALVESRLTLPEAAERVRSERESRLPPFHMKPALDPGESLDAYYLRFTVELVERHLEGQECKREVIQRLQLELQNCLATQSEYSTTEADPYDEPTE